MGKERDRNLLFAVLAVQLRNIAPEKVIEVAGAWAVNPADPLSVRLHQAGYITSEDVVLLEQLVDQMVAACRGDVEQALGTIHGARDITASISGRRPTPPVAPAPRVDATRPMDDKFPFDPDAEELSVIDETEGRYSQISEHGRGGMGRVLLVHDQYLGREIALKELLLPRSSAETRDPMRPESPMRETTARLARFVQEARITGQLEHPSIVPVYELGRRRDGTFYYTMRLVRGRTMEQALRDEPSLEGRLRLLPNLLDLCQAVAYAHSRFVIHRDIKPANVMIGEFGETVLLDWGLAKIRGAVDVYAEKLSHSLQLLRLEVTGNSPQTEHGEAVGTPHYMPPEQARGLIAELDERSDIYSVGAVLYELLTGQPPFSGRTPEAVLFQVIEKEPKRIPLLVNGAPPELVSICEKAMAKDPDRRYQSMKELRDELLRFQTGAFVQAYKYSPGQVIARWYKRHRMPLNTAAAAAVMLLAVGAYSYVNIWRSNERALRQQYLAQVRLAQAYIEDQEMRLANEALDSAPAEERDWAWGYLKNLANADEFTVRSDSSAIHLAMYDPTGQHILAMRDTEAPGLWNAADGRHERDFEGEPAQYNLGHFNDDGTLFGAIGEHGVLDVWHTATGKRLQRLLNGDEMGFGIAFVPGAQRVWASYANGQLIEWNVDSGTEARRLQAAGPAGSLAIAPKADLLLAIAGNQITAWKLSSGEVAWQLPGSNFWMSANEEVVVLNTPEGKLSLHDTITGELQHTLDGAGERIFDVAFSKDAARILAAPMDGTVRMYQRGDSAPQRMFYTGAPVLMARFADDGSRVVAGTGNNRYFVWDTDTGAELFKLAGENASLPFADLSRDGRHLVTASSFRTFKVFDALAPKGVSALAEAAPEQSYGTDLAFARNGGRVAALWVGSKAGVYDLPGLKPLAQFAVAPGISSQLGISPDGKKVLFWQDPQRIAVGDVDTEKVVLTFDKHAAPLTASAVSMSENIAASADESNTVLVWDILTGSVLATLKAPGRTYALALAHAPTRVLCGGDDGAVRVFDVPSGNITATIQAHRNAVMALALQHAQHLLSTVARDGSVAFWDLATGNERARFNSEESALPLAPNVLALRFSQDDRYLLTRMNSGKSLTIDTLDFSTPIRRAEPHDAVLLSSGLLQANANGVLSLLNIRPGT